jgi:glycosyltransferase involved in cell wall biosynthesis
METTPLISVIMPAYNAERYIEQAINSILHQTWQNFELLICDDGSHDKTFALAGSYHDKRIKLMVNDENIGYLKTCNKLFTLTTGEYIAFQDADDYCDPSRLAKQVDAFKNDAALGMVGTWASIVDVHGTHIDDDQRAVTYHEIIETLPKSSQFNGATIMVSRKVLDDIGGYREFFNDYAYQDYDWAYRIAEKYKSINLSDALYYYRQSEGGNSKKISIKRSISAALVQYLAKQRKDFGKDDIQLGNLHSVENFINEMSAPYKKDPALLYREYSGHYMYGRLYHQAIAAAATAVKLNPQQLVNWRTLQYCIRKYLLSFIVK